MAYFDSNGYKLYEIYLSDTNKLSKNSDYVPFFSTDNTLDINNVNNPILKMIATNYPTIYDNVLTVTTTYNFKYSYIAGSHNDDDITWTINLQFKNEIISDAGFNKMTIGGTTISKSFSSDVATVGGYSFYYGFNNPVGIRVRMYGCIIIDTNNVPAAIGYCVVCSTVGHNGIESAYQILQLSPRSNDLFVGCFNTVLDNGAYEVIFAPPEEREFDNSKNTQINGGYGTGQNPTDTIEIPALPTFSIASAGSQLYKLTQAQMLAFTNWLWTSDWQDNIKKIRTNPIENIIGVSITDIAVSGTAQTIKVGNIETEIQAQAINNWITIDCGSIALEEYYGSFADYEPFIATTLYLPKVGFVQIPADVCMNNTIKVVYNIELSSGEGLCFVYITNKRDGFSYIYNTYSCTVTGNIPLSATDHTQQLIASANFALNTTTALASAAAGAPTNYNPVSDALKVVTAKNPTTTTGHIGNMSAMMCVKKPYLLINRTVLTKPSAYQDNNGYLVMYTATIGSHTGFLKTRDFHAEFNAPYNHKVEIERIMNEGVFING